MARSSASCLLGEVFDQRCQRRDVADNDTDIILDDGPDDGLGAVEVVG